MNELNWVIGKDRRNIYMGISILCVFFFHVVSFSNRYWSEDIPILDTLFDHGYFGVDIFLYLSSIGLCFSLSKENTLFGSKRYWQNRIKRIFPLYFVFLVLLFSIFLRDKTTKEIILESVGQCSGLSTFTFIPGKLEWYTPALILMYLFYPLWFCVIKKLNASVGGGKLFIIEQIMLISFCYIQSTEFCRHYVSAELLPRLPIIVVATFTYFHLQKNEIREIAILYVLLATMPFFMNMEFAVMQFCIPLILFVIACRKVKIPFEKFFIFIGKYSFEIYLAQVLTTKYFMQTNWIDSHYVIILIVLVSTPLIAYLLHKVHAYK